MVLEAGSPSWSRQQVWFLHRPLSLACRWPSFPWALRGLPSLRACVIFSYKDTSPIGVASALMASLTLHHLFKDLISRPRRILRRGELGPQHESGKAHDTWPWLNTRIMYLQGKFGLTASWVEFPGEQTPERWRMACRGWWGAGSGICTSSEGSRI